MPQVGALSVLQPTPHTLRHAPHTHSYADGWCVLSDMATIVGNATIAKECATMCARVTDAIVAKMWNQDLNRFVTL